LINRHFGGMAMDKLHKTTALAGRDLDIGDLSESLEEGAKLVLCDVSRQSTDKHRGVVRVGELVHGLHRVKRSALAVESGCSTPHGRSGGVARNRWHHWISRTVAMSAVLVGAVAGSAIVCRLRQLTITLPSLRGRSGDAHGSVPAVHTLHLDEGALLIRLVREANEAVASRLARHRIRHDLGRLARRKSALEQRDKNKLVDLRSKVTHENTEFRATVVPISTLAKT
jgi:hypothetical protein